MSQYRQTQKSWKLAQQNLVCINKGDKPFDLRRSKDHQEQDDSKTANNTFPTSYKKSISQLNYQHTLAKHTYEEYELTAVNQKSGMALMISFLLS